MMSSWWCCWLPKDNKNDDDIDNDDEEEEEDADVDDDDQEANRRQHLNIKKGNLRSSLSWHIKGHSLCAPKGFNLNRVIVES